MPNLNAISAARYSKVKRTYVSMKNLAKGIKSNRECSRSANDIDSQSSRAASENDRCARNARNLKKRCDPEPAAPCAGDG